MKNEKMLNRKWKLRKMEKQIMEFKVNGFYGK